MDADLDWDMCVKEPATSRGVDDGPGPLSFFLPTGLSSAATPTSDGCQETSILVSTIFYPHHKGVVMTPDRAIKSSDGIIFYLNASVLTTAGATNFPSTPIQDERLDIPAAVVQVPESSVVLTIILCTIYGIQWGSFSPTFDDISAAIDCMPANSLAPKNLIQKGSPLYTLLMTHHVPIRPLAVYTIAAQHDIEPLAQDVSAHLLALEVDDIDDDSAVKMGTTYLMRLILLSTNRITALKAILRDTNPMFHALDQEKECNEAIQEEMRIHWVCTVTQFTWGVKSDLSSSSIRQICLAASQHIPCGVCKKSWTDCVEEVAVRWEQVKSTI